MRWCHVNLILLDPNKKHTISTSSYYSNVDYVDYSLYEGRYVIGTVKKVFLDGDLIVDGDRWLGRKGGRKYQKRSASGVF